MYDKRNYPHCTLFYFFFQKYNPPTDKRKHNLDTGGWHLGETELTLSPQSMVDDYQVMFVHIERV